MRIESKMRLAKRMSTALALAILLLVSGSNVRAQSSAPGQTIQGAKQQLEKAAGTQQTAPPLKQQATSAPPAKSQTPAKSQAPAKIQAPAKSKPGAPAAKSPAKTAANTPAKAQASAPAKTPAKAPAKKSTAAPAKTPAKAPAKSAASAQGKPAAGKAPTGKAPAKESKGKPVAKPEPQKVARRDPFAPLLNTQGPGGPSSDHLPPGKAGLVIATLRIQGIVSGPNGMIAIVANPQQSVYFVREGDQLYDGRVTKISMDSVSFHEFGKDAFGKPVDRQVTKRLYPSAGE
jgi:Tfp pilus assembly protein PilP